MNNLKETPATMISCVLFPVLSYAVMKSLGTDQLASIFSDCLVKNSWVIFLTVICTMSLVSSFHMSSGFSCSLSNMCTEFSALSRIASKNIVGKNLVTVINTLGPTSLSDSSLENNSATFVRLSMLLSLQKTFNKYNSPPCAMICLIILVLDDRFSSISMASA